MQMLTYRGDFCNDNRDDDSFADTRDDLSLLFIIKFDKLSNQSILMVLHEL